jgi:hypothetical protein
MEIRLDRPSVLLAEEIFSLERIGALIAGA